MNRTDLLRAARRRLAEGNPAAVLDACASLVRTEPDDVEARYVMAAATLALGHAGEAKSLVERCCELAPGSIDSRILLTECLLEGGKFGEASDSARAAMAIMPADERAIAAGRRVEERVSTRNRLLQQQRRPVTADQCAELQRDFPRNCRQVPIIINTRDRYTCLRRLLTWLEKAGYANIVLIDNGSTYKPLLAYFREIADRVIIYRLQANLGHTALWRSGLAEVICGDAPFVYTDPDIMPIEECPADGVVHLHRLLREYAWASKAGFGIRIDDLPDSYADKQAVIQWESRYWRRPVPGNGYIAAVDTTFALYRPRSWYQLEAVRSGFPYLIRHLPWYEDGPSSEAEYYSRHALAGISTWSGGEIRHSRTSIC
jgi:hypothetical protein